MPRFTARPSPQSGVAAKSWVRIHLKKNDTVKVIAGKDKGKTGRVLSIDRRTGRVLVEGVQMVKRHTRPNPGRQIKGGIAERESPIAVSNLMVMFKRCNKRARVGLSVMQGGRKVRVCKNCDELLDE